MRRSIDSPWPGHHLTHTCTQMSLNTPASAFQIISNCIQALHEREQLNYSFVTHWDTFWRALRPWLW